MRATACGRPRRRRACSPDAAALVAGDPDLQADSIHDLLARRAADGSLSLSVDELEGLARDGLQAVDAQTTTALDDHTQVARTCPGQFCDFYRDREKADGAAGRDAIAGRQASLAAVTGLLTQSDADLARALQAEAQGAAQVAGAVNAYYAATDYGEYVHIGSDVAGLVIGLAAIEVDPAAAITGVINVVGDIVGVSVQGPDANQLILDGLKGVSTQLSSFAQATAAQFRAVDARLEALAKQVSDVAENLSTQLSEVRTQLTTLDDRLSTLQTSVDRLESEIQSLFAAQAHGTLQTLINSSIGYATRNQSALSAFDFGQDADGLFTHATSIASGPTVAAAPGVLDAKTAASIDGLDAHLNFFSAFAGGPLDDARSAWPGALGSRTSRRELLGGGRASVRPAAAREPQSRGGRAAVGAARRDRRAGQGARRCAGEDRPARRRRPRDRQQAVQRRTRLLRLLGRRRPRRRAVAAAGAAVRARALPLARARTDRSGPQRSICTAARARRRATSPAWTRSRRSRTSRWPASRCPTRLPLRRSSRACRRRSRTRCG